MSSRDVINALLPEGFFWVPATDDDYDKLLDGIADNSDAVFEDLEELRYLRDPARTPILSDLEKEYAVVDYGDGTKRKVNMSLVDGKIGDYVLVHAGFAIQILDEKEAFETLNLFREIISKEEEQ